MFEGTPEEYESLRLRKIRRDKEQARKKALEAIMRIDDALENDEYYGLEEDIHTVIEYIKEREKHERQYGDR